MTERMELPCCGLVDVRRVMELPHVYGFDFDLFQCGRCGRYWAYAWAVAASQGHWEPVSADDAQKMQALDGDALRSFMRAWAKDLD